MLERIASRLGRNDDEPNIDLAKDLAARMDAKGVAEIAAGLGSKDAAVASDCVKVLYEVGYREPGLIAGYADTFVALLSSRNNRLVWGAAIALGRVAPLARDALLAGFDSISRAYQAGSVITRDNCVGVFAGIASGGGRYEERAFPLILRHLETCRPKELGQHAERAFPCVNEGNSGKFAAVLRARYDSLADPQKKRVDALLKKIEKKKFG
jgi:hypothetical protein